MKHSVFSHQIIVSSRWGVLDSRVRGNDKRDGKIRFVLPTGIVRWWMI